MAYVYNETPSGTINSSNVTFTLAFTPNPTGSLQLFYNGVLQELSTDYTLATKTITFTVAPVTGSILAAFYAYDISSNASSGYLAATTTVQNILDSCAMDAMELMPGDSGRSKNLAIDYVNRIHQQLSRFSRWQWQQSGIQRFITIGGQSDYWLGASGSSPAGTVDTGLNLTDLYQIKEGTVFDRTSFRELKKTLNNPPVSRGIGFPDASLRQTPPKEWREAPESPNVISLFPAPDRTTAGLYRPVPENPYCTSTSGGALGNRVYFVRVTFVDSNGNESTPNVQATRIFIPASSYLKVWSPTIPISKSADGIQYSQYKVYVSTTENAEVVQNSGTAINLGSNWTESGSGIVSGTAAWPTANNIEPLYGYVIEFRYWKQRSILSLTTDVLQIPDQYKDIVVAGVNSLIFRYISRYANDNMERNRYLEEANQWAQQFNLGKTEIIKDFNLFPKDADFIGPDKNSIRFQTWPDIVNY